MSGSAEQELEAKFYISNLTGLEERLQAIGAVLAEPRVHEVNLRFDTREGALTARREVLRLRHPAPGRAPGTHHAILTYKGAAQPGQAVSLRQEVEVVVNDLTSCRRILECLGYQVSVLYEKWRTTYRWQNVLIMLDEMPYGTFAEIEGDGVADILVTAMKLNLKWEARSTESYTGLFRLLKDKFNLSMRDLSFENFEGLHFTPEDLELEPAD